MGPKLFLTGITGYIGGDALHAIAGAHPDWEITALVRNSDKGAKVAAQYPTVRLVYSNLDDAELLERESRDADIVGNFADSFHESSIHAILRGLAGRDGRPASFLIHNSGTGSLTYEDVAKERYGSTSAEKIYDDLHGLEEVTSLPDAALCRMADKIVLEAAKKYGSHVKTAIVCSPAIYGLGRGPDNQRSHQLPELCRCALEKGWSFEVNEGKSRWSTVHIQDVSALYLKLFEEAVAGGSTAEWPEKPEVWGPRGFFFCESGEHAWGEVAQWVAEEGKRQGMFQTDEVRSISVQEAMGSSVNGAVFWGTNSRARGLRAREALRWKPTGPALQNEVQRALEFEARRRGLKVGHAQVAAGNI